MDRPETVAQLTQLLRGGGYLADRGLATALFVALSLGRPILIEGEVGVGKTEVAKALAAVFDRRLIRLQCYEGIDTNQALYEWDYARQMLQIRALSERQLDSDEAVDTLFGPKFLLERPLLEAVRAGDRAVLLIDEIDRADDEFEAFLLEMLADFQITIPEIGTIRAETPPLVVLTSNRTRELHDALKRRCLYHWVGYPSPEREVEIVLVRAPGASEALTRKVVAAVNRLRGLDLAKPPGVAETIDWVRTLDVLGATDLDAAHGRRHAGRGRQGARRPRAGAGQPGRDRLGWLTGRRRWSACWSPSPVELRRRGPGRRLGRRARPTARPWPRSTRPTCSTCTGPGAPRWSPGASTSRSTTGCSGGFFLDDGDDAAGAGAAHDPLDGRDPSRCCRYPRPSPAPTAATSGRRGSAWSARTPRCCGTRRSRPARRRAGQRCGGSSRGCGSPRRGGEPGARSPPGAGRVPDPRRTVRETMRTHGEPSTLFWRRRRLRLRPLILILDVSGSMADYSRNLLQFAYSARRASTRVGGVLLRHPAHPHHPGAGAAPGRRRHGAGRPGRLRLGGRHPHRRLAGHLRPGLGAPRRVPGRDRGDLLRRARPGRPAGAGHRDGAAGPAVPPGGVDEPAQGHQPRLPAEHIWA